MIIDDNNSNNRKNMKRWNAGDTLFWFIFVGLSMATFFALVAVINIFILFTYQRMLVVGYYIPTPPPSSSNSQIAENILPQNTIENVKNNLCRRNEIFSLDFNAETGGPHLLACDNFFLVRYNGVPVGSEYKTVSYMFDTEGKPTGSSSFDGNGNCEINGKPCNYQFYSCKFGEPDLCKGIQLDCYSDRCQLINAERLSDWKFCSNILEREIQNICFTEVASLAGNDAICAKINDSYSQNYTKKYCYSEMGYNFGLKAKNKDDCQPLNELARQKCYEAYEINNRNQ